MSGTVHTTSKIDAAIVHAAADWVAAGALGVGEGEWTQPGLTRRAA
jgi:hypothetical protein